MISRLFHWWCQFAHRKISRPYLGRYTCLECLRTYYVPWEEGDRARAEDARRVPLGTSSEVEA